MTLLAGDIDRIMMVMATAFDPDFGEAWTRRQVEDALLVGNCHYFLAAPECRHALSGEEVAGFSLSRTGIDDEELLLFAVTPERRNKGIGQYIIDKLISSAKERGVNRLILEMRRDNPAESLYRKNGFRPIGIRRNYYKKSDTSCIDAITFECFIQ